MRRPALAVLSGIILSLSFPSWANPSLNTNMGFLAWVGLVPLLWAIDHAPVRRAFIIGWIGGTAFFASTIYWIACIREMEYMAIPAWLAFSLFLGLFWGVWAWGVSASGRRSWIAGPALWILLEWLRGHLFTGFPWAVLGSTQWHYPQIFLSARYAGTMAVSFGIVAINIAIWRFRLAGLFRIPAVVVAIFSLGTLTILSFMAQLAIKDDSLGKPAVKIALLQGNFTEEEKWSLPMEMMVGRYEELSRRAGRENVAVIVWPETATAGELSRDRITSDKLIKISRKTGAVHVVGAILNEDGRYYNAAYVVSAGGIQVPFRKSHLVPFGEYIPSWIRTMMPFAKKLTEGVIDYSPGISPSSAMTGPIRSGVQVCYESIFPDISRAQVLSGADVFINLTNDAWYLRTASTYQHALGPICRSVEFGRWMVRCANTGLSFFCSPSGSLRNTMPIFETGFQVMEIVPVSRITPYAKYGDAPLVCLALLALALAYIPASRDPKRP